MALWAGPDQKLWTYEVRGKVVWCREGKSGNRGRIWHEELADGDAALVHAEQLVGARQDVGYRKVLDHFQFDSPKLRQTKPAQPKSSPTEVARWLEEELKDRTQTTEGNLTLREVVGVVSCGPDCEYWTWSLSVEANSRTYSVRRQMSRGWRDNPDDGEWEVITIHAHDIHADDVEIEFEEFLVSPLDFDKKRESVTSLGRRLTVGLAEDSEWAPLLEREVGGLSVTCE